MDHTSEHPPHEHHEHHVTPVSTYIKTYLILVVFMALTVGASYVPLGPLNNVVAMIIALVKATLVVLFFMQVKYGTKLTWFWALLGFVWFLFLFITLQDYI